MGKKLNTILISFLFVLSSCLICPAQTYQWGIAKGTSTLDFGSTVATDKHGNVFAGGFSPYSTYIISYTPNGSIRWELTITGGGDKQVLGLHVDQGGTVYATGTFTVSLTIGSHTIQGGNDREIFIISLDNNGNYRWGFGITGHEEDHGEAICSDQAGNIYVTGSFNSINDFDPGPGSFDLESMGQEDVFIASYDPSGSFRWARRAGGYGFDYGNGIGVNTMGQVVVGGSITGTSDFDPVDSTAIVNGYGWDAFIVSFDTSGLFQWVKSIGGPGNDHCRDLTVDHRGDIYITGEYEDSVDFDLSDSTFMIASFGESDIFLAKYSPQGEFIWASGMGGPGYDRGHGVAVDTFGRSYITGLFRHTADFDPGSSAQMLTAASPSSGYIGNYGSLGQYLWAFAYNGHSEGGRICVNHSSEFIVTGNFAQAFDADPSAGVATISRLGGWDAYIIKYANSNPGPTAIETSQVQPIAFSLCPNPVHDELIIRNNRDFRHGTRLQIQVYDLQGKILLSQYVMLTQTYRLKLQSLSFGMYWVQLKDQEGNTECFKIVKQP